MLDATRALAVLLVVPFLHAPSVATAQPADKPALRSSVPAHVEAPRDQGASRPPRAVQRTAAAAAKEKININSAEVKQLMTLEGVSRKVAERIVAYRDTHGPFKKPAELRKVDGVDDTVLEKNRGRISVR